eukprot:3203391-Amphidinium_carterae.1
MRVASWLAGAMLGGANVGPQSCGNSAGLQCLLLNTCLSECVRFCSDACPTSAKSGVRSRLLSGRASCKLDPAREYSASASAELYATQDVAKESAKRCRRESAPSSCRAVQLPLDHWHLPLLMSGRLLFPLESLLAGFVGLCSGMGAFSFG